MAYLAAPASTVGSTQACSTILTLGNNAILPIPKPPIGTGSFIAAPQLVAAGGGTYSYPVG